MELNCPSYDYVLDMTWAEFLIRSYAYNRIQERLDFRAREIAWAAFIAPHTNAKKIPKNKNVFWQIGEKKITVNEGMQKAIEDARNQYFEQLKNKQKNG